MKRVKIASIILGLLFIFSFSLFADDDYNFDVSKFTKKPFEIGGNIEVIPSLLLFNESSSIYNLKYYSNPPGVAYYNLETTLQLNSSLRWSIFKLYALGNADVTYGYHGLDYTLKLFEGYLSVRPADFLSFDLGKEITKWGKGYIYNPVSFIDRPKSVSDPEASFEGYTIFSADYIKSFNGPLQTMAFTPVLIPVVNVLNEGFGEKGYVNFAGKLYLLLFNTDIDFVTFLGRSKANSFGFDLSKNILSNLEIHAEASYIPDYQKSFVDQNLAVSSKAMQGYNALFGIKYLTQSETTFILEYFHKNIGFDSNEMSNYYSYIDNAYGNYLVSKNDELLKKANFITKNYYNSQFLMKDYMYLKVSHNEPFNILHFNPSLAVIFNINDGSSMLIPTFNYNPITNLNFKLSSNILLGKDKTEYGEKPNTVNIGLSIKKYF